MKIFTGVVISKKMQSTASVQVSRVIKHKLYGKRLKRTKIYQVHDEKETKVGDRVRFVATKPFSKTKKWVVTEIVVVKSKKAVSNKK